MMRLSFVNVLFLFYFLFLRSFFDRGTLFAKPGKMFAFFRFLQVFPLRDIRTPPIPSFRRMFFEKRGIELKSVSYYNR